MSKSVTELTVICRRHVIPFQSSSLNVVLLMVIKINNQTGNHEAGASVDCHVTTSLSLIAYCKIVKVMAVFNRFVQKVK